MQLCKKISGLALVTILSVACSPVNAPSEPPELESTVGNTAELLLHVPSPQWQDQIIYLAMIDRFADGDPTNNSQAQNEYDPTKESHYSGGDLVGLVQHLDYIRKLGATALWTTPQVANLWWDPLSNYGGYHGYWARDFKAVDEHFGTLADYQALSSGLHQRGMYLIQDVVVNHTGNFFTYQGDYDEHKVTDNFVLNHSATPGSAPSQYPFTLNDANNAEHRKAAIYNWTPSIVNFADPKQETTYQTADLDDLNTSNPVVRSALKDSFAYWIEQAGVDAIRIDTAKYVESDFFSDFLHAPDGLKAAAQSTGRDDFFSFGEIYETSLPMADNGEQKLKQYVSDSQHQRIDAPIGFPLYKEISRVFAGGMPTQYLSYRLEAQMRLFNEPFKVVNFIDNHDVERFLAAGNIAGFKQAYTLMMTVPGIPTIYQGDEQAFKSSRRAMFAGGYLSQFDQFNQHSPMYLFIQQLTELRKKNLIFSRGSIEILQDNAAGAGILAYKRNYQGKVAYVIFNTAKHEVLLNALQTDFVENNKPLVLINENLQETLRFDVQGLLTTVLPAQAVVVLLGDEREGNQPQLDIARSIEPKNLQSLYQNQVYASIKGTSDYPHSDLLVVIDGKLTDAKTIHTNATGQWQTELAVNDLGTHQHQLEIYSPTAKVASAVYYYQTQSDQVSAQVQVSDPLNDDHGLERNYTKPLDPTVACQMDIIGATAQTGGKILKLSLKMCELSHIWAPPNGFDHVAFTLFFDLPTRTGMSELPVIGGQFPDGAAWDLAHVAYGWANYVYWPTQATALHEGEKAGIAPPMAIDYQNNSIEFTYDGAELGIEDWAGVSIYVTTWDKSGEGNYRELAENANTWTFGGGSLTSPKILDAVLLELAKKP
ncbi:alpha-amylase family glycosyl hydrolase [Paraglaciecola hydrolytica]|uniref:Alpha-amylase n=1 Tax=Paraglaciecola hydrolytica TaxID=1799789 RepID=A0A148KLB6_9ALTE|nr:alpha-amylase family glycosyl hydrolase [Paraglaciecola hydrolytica]KXI27087.1 alpha-amylase [Paraglaciecola hydrolytica]